MNSAPCRTSPHVEPARRRAASRIRLNRAALLAFAAISLMGCSAPKPPPTVKLFVESDGDYLVFRPDNLTVKAGSHVVLTFRHGGTIISQDHDWVLTKPAAMKTLLTESDRMAGGTAMEGQSFLRPGDPRVIASTKLIKKGETTTIEFTAPPPGDYPFFCSTPGHAESMTGVLHVTAQ